MSTGTGERKTRSFAMARDQHNETGLTAAQIRSRVSDAFRVSVDGGELSSPVSSGAGSSVSFGSALGALGSAGLTPPPLSHSTSVTSTVGVGLEQHDPIDYEKFVKENQTLIDSLPLREMLVFPVDDVSTTTVGRKFRTVEMPVPGVAKRSDDPLVRDCVRSFTQDWTVVNRKFGSFYGQDDEFLSQRFATCKRTHSYSKLLPKHQYEVDMPPSSNSISDDQKRLYRASMTSMVDYNLEAAESDKLLLSLLEVKDDNDMDEENTGFRKSNRHASLFGLYPLPDRRDAPENRTPSLPPSEHQGLRLLIKVSELRFDLSIEPIFAVVALYDAKEKKKISETFHLDCNPSDIQHMLDDYMDERSMASLSRSGIFNITYPNSDVFLIVKIEKVLQQGDVSEAAEPYMKARDLDKKTLEKHKVNANFTCQQLGKYRMPFAWTAINVLDILAGNQQSGGTSETRKSSVTDREGLEKRGSTPEPNRRRDTRSGSLSTQNSRSGLEDSYNATDSTRKQDTAATLTQNFCPVTLTVNAVFKQESDRLSDEDLFRMLSEMKKSSASMNRKFRSIPGNLKVDISAPGDNMPCCLTSNLWEIDPFPDNRSRRPTREIEEFPPMDVYAPHTTYKNMMYVYPLSLDFRSGKGRNVGVKVQFMAGEDKEDVCPHIYGKSCSPSFLREAWCPVLYHNRQPEFYEEIKIELPAKLTDKHHLLFSFYQISCQKPKPGENFVQEPHFLGCTWIPIVLSGKLQLGEFNLCVTADRPPPAYSQLSSDVALPNLKWIDGHKPVFRVNINMVSSIHPKDIHVLDFMGRYYEMNPRLGSPLEEKTLGAAIDSLKGANSEAIVHFLHITLNNLASLLVRPTVTEESADIPSKAFESLSSLVQRVQKLDLPTDKHGRNGILSSYVQYVFSAPLAQHNPGAFDSRTATLKGRHGSTEGGDYMSSASAASAAFKKGGSVRGTKGVSFNMPEYDEVDSGMGRKTNKKVFHEEMVLQWIVAHPSNTRPLVLKNAWFFFEILVKSMANFLSRNNKLNASRTDRFSRKFHDDLETLVGFAAVDICQRHIKDVDYARRLNTSLAFFIHDAFSLMDRGFVFQLIRTYLKKFTLSPKDLNLPEFRLDFYRIVCSHEHYVTLNLPLGVALYPMGSSSQHSSPSGSISSTFENLDLPNVEAMGELGVEFRTHHYLSGLVLGELAQTLDGKSSKLREQAIQVLRDLLASHDSDARYNSPESRARIASIYLPLLSVLMESYTHLYKGADGWEDWTTTFERNTSVRRSVVIRESYDGGLEIEQNEGNEPNPENILGPVSTRNLLICFLWVLKNIDQELIIHWWNTLSLTRLHLLLNVMDLCVSCFEYKGKRNLSNNKASKPVKPGTTGTPSKPSDAVKNQLANAILFGEGSARERLRQRRRYNEGADVLRWGKTYWQASSEHSDRPKVDIEVDALIEGSLAAEASLIVLDSLELLVQSFSLENQSMLGQALEVLLHLMGSDQSIEVTRCLYATQRAIVSKFPELVFEEETEQCAELCTRLLRHCSSSVDDIRAWACASLYLLMRQNFEMGNTFARVKVQVTVALSSIVAGTGTFNEHHLRRSLKTIINYASQDSEMSDTTFPEQVRQLSLNLHRILLDTVKMQEYQDDPEMLMDLMYRISKGYQNSPDIRLTWLQHMAEKHSSWKNSTEAAMCLVHAAALVAEYLYLLEGRPHLPVGCVAFQKLSPNVLEESAVSDDVITPEEEGICTSKLFTEKGLVELLELAASHFKEAQLFEAVNEVYKLVAPIYEARREHAELEKVYRALGECCKEIVQRGQNRFIGSYFRVGFYGLIFGDLDRQEFVYKEAGLTRLGEFSLKLQKLYEDKVGKSDLIELLKDSGLVDTKNHQPQKGYIQVTYVEPYFDDWELGQRVTVFDRSFNIRRFVFSTPFTPGGKAHGDVDQQYMRKTIIVTQDIFPYVKRRSKVVRSDSVDISPLEVAILGMQDKIKSLNHSLQQVPPDPKLLQMQLQGGIATAVNQGPFYVAQMFLEHIPKAEQTHLHRKLKICFKEFTRRCSEALDVNNSLMGEERSDYQKELSTKFKDFRDKLEPMVSTKKKHKRSRDRALHNIASSRSSRAHTSTSEP